MKRTTASLLILALVLLVAVALINLVQNLQALSFGERAIQVPRIVPPFVNLGIDPLILAWVLSLVGLGIFLVAFFRFRPRGGKFPFEELIPLALGALFLLGILFLANPFVQSEEGLPSEDETGNEEPRADDQGPNNPLESLQRALPAAPGMLALLLSFAAFVGIYLLMMTFQARRAQAAAAAFKRQQEQRLKQEISEVLEERIYGLEMGADVRSVILGTYRDMVNLFRSYGLRTASSQTVREVELLALKNLGLSGEASKDLRSQFEEARYSVHPLGEAQRNAAIDSLRRVKLDLGG